MQHTDISFVPLLIVITLAFLVPLLLARVKGLGIPVVVDISPDMDGSQAVREVKLQNSQLVDWRLADLRLPGDALVLMIERKGDILVPQRDTVLRANDIVTLVGSGTYLNDAVRLFVRNE